MGESTNTKNTNPYSTLKQQKQIDKQFLFKNLQLTMEQI